MNIDLPDAARTDGELDSTAAPDEREVETPVTDAAELGRVPISPFDSERPIADNVANDVSVPMPLTPENTEPRPLTAAVLETTNAPEPIERDTPGAVTVGRL